MPIINSVIAGGGTTPTGTISITSNGTHDVTNYASADVNVPTTAPEIYRVFRVDNGMLKNSITTPFIPLPSTVTDISAYCLAYAYTSTPPSVLSGAIDLSSLTTASGVNACSYMFYSCTGITSVDLSSLTTASGSGACNNMFSGCTGITSVDLSSLTTASGVNACSYMFSGCTGITSVDLSSLTTASGSSACNNMFYGCTGITSVDLSSLTTASGGNACNNMFYGCTGITSVDLSSLTTASGSGACTSMFSGCTGITSVDLSSLTTASGVNACSYMFSGCTNLTSLSFPAITTTSFGTRVNQFIYMCSGVSNVTIHFPSNTQAKIETISGYSTTAPFGATAGTVLFDLPATNTLTGADSNTYSRNPKYDTATSLAWKVGAYGTTDFTPAYYTSGTTDPAVSDAIYSDAACTQSVTTITAIA